jgi:preprotein translocase subunit SecG
MQTVLQVVFGVVLFLLSVFLILLILVQRGRGGGLAGAFGGLGGQSAFGTKAGDTFTKVTMWTAASWILLCMLAILMLPSGRLSGGGGGSLPGSNAPATPGGTDTTPGGGGAGAAPSSAAPSGAGAAPGGAGAAPSGTPSGANPGS